MNIYWGDLHAHSGYSKCYWKDYGTGDLSDLLTYARNEGGLDFCAPTDHASHMSEDDWKNTRRIVSEFREPHEFVAMLGYEWTSYRYGHHNVYFPGLDGPFISARNTNGEQVHPSVLFEALEGVESLVIPHHPAVTQFRVDWSANRNDKVKLLEISSIWGNWEYSGNPHPSRMSDIIPGHCAAEQLLAGRRFGFTGGSDSHDNHPGDIFFGERRKPNGNKFDANPIGVVPARFICDASANTRGITAVLSDELTPEALWKALLARHTYATTGARIDISFNLNGVYMGDEIRFPADGSITVNVEVSGTAPLTSVEIIRNAVVCMKTGCTGNRAEISFEDRPDPSVDTWYYLRVTQDDGHYAWSSPVWVNAAEDQRSFKRTPQQELESVRINVAQAAAGSEAVLPDLSDTPVAVTHKKIDGLHHVIIGWNGTDDACEGVISLRGVRSYRAEDINFCCRKYGGDLFTDNGEGIIRWYLYRGEPKGIRIICAAGSGLQFSMEVLCGQEPARITGPDKTGHEGTVFWRC